MKKIILGMLILMFTIISCGGKQDNKANGKEEKVLTVGTNATYPPFEYVENGEVKGFDIDLITQIGTELGYKVNVIDQSFDGLIPNLKAGKIDLAIAGMSASEERKKSVDFTDAYFKSTEVYIKRKGNNNVTSIDNLKGKKLGSQLGSIQETTAKNIPGAISVPNESIVNLILDLKAGKIDVLLLDNIVASEYIKKNPEMEIFGEIENQDEGMAIAADKGKRTELIQKINEKLKEYKENGKYNQLLEKYGLKLGK